MDRELRELHQGARNERRNLTPDPADVPGHGRVGGVDDPVDREEYGDAPNDVDRHTTCDHPELVAGAGDIEVVHRSPSGVEIEANCAECGATLSGSVTVGEMGSDHLIDVE